jgi:hypothetical protein
MSLDDLSSTDITTLQDTGLEETDVQRQLELLRHPPAPVRLLRPCTLGDGLVQLRPEEWDRLEKLAAGEAAKGTFAKFVPASGAATRMFGSLLRAWSETPPPSWQEILHRADGGDSVAEDVARLLDDLDRFPFQDQLRDAATDRGWDLSVLREDGNWHDILDLLLTDEGLGYIRRPKALVPFHRVNGGAATAFEEQIEEGRGYLRDAAGCARYHFTVEPGALPAFERTLGAIRALHDESASRLLVEFSQQSPGTNTIALGDDGHLVRDAAGVPISRPGGHGALLSNLQRTDAELVFIRNIDNVLPAGALREDSVRWRRRLGGLLVSVRDRARSLIEELQTLSASPAARATARRFLTERFRTLYGGPDEQSEAGRRHLIELLDRPIRICGMVPNQGEPGGGPFWIETATGPSRQIVEGAQVDLKNTAQHEIWNASTHFNPVDLVCCLRDAHGKPYELAEFTDPNAVIVARKLVDGQPAHVLERPGLWNGGMAAWNSVFVEIPATVFAPVKTVFDLLRPKHQPGE